MKPGGRVVVFTPNRWSAVSILTVLVPNRWHHRLTGLLWSTRAENVFPTFFRMNTRRRLRAAFEAGGFQELAFARLDTVDTFHRFRATYLLELCLWRALRQFGVGYPESTLLGVYRKR